MSGSTSIVGNRYVYEVGCTVYGTGTSYTLEMNVALELQS
jgi:hypothetical protein